MKYSPEDEKMIYMDHAATTFCYKEAVDAMIPFFTVRAANPAAVYRYAGDSAKAVAEARRAVASSIGADPSEIIFTSGGSEADNQALLSHRTGHIITSTIEHHAILETCRYLESQGTAVTYIPVDETGYVDPALIKAAIRPETSLISVMMANNEVGTIEPVEEIGKIASEYDIMFHTDAVQAYGHIPIDVKSMNIDMLSASAHKMGGPKGTGFLYVRNGLRTESLIHGGSQERGLRAGTLNVPGIVGLAAASKEAIRKLDENSEYVSVLRDSLIEGITERIPGVKLNGRRTGRLPGNVNFSFEGIEGETLLILLDREHICASSGSACATGALDPSHVLLAMGLDREPAAGSLRLSLSEQNTMEEVNIVIGVLEELVGRLRQMRSPMRK